MTHLATRYYLSPERWLPKEGRAVGRTKEEKEVNAYLDNLRGLIFAKYNEMFLLTQFNLSTNYVMKTILKFKSVYQVAIDNGWAQKNPFASFKFHYEQAERGYLPMEELTILMQKAMPSKRLEQIRDVFVFSCFTSLAYCDARALTRTYHHRLE